MFVYQMACLSTTGNVCLPQGMFVYHRACCLPQGTFVHHRESLSTTGGACLPQGICVYHGACLLTTGHVRVCGVAVHVDPPAALSSCQKNTSVGRDRRKCLLWAVSGRSLACWDPPWLPISRYTCCSATSSCSSWGSSKTCRVHHQSADSSMHSLIVEKKKKKKKTLFSDHHRSLLRQQPETSFVFAFIHSLAQSLVHVFPRWLVNQLMLLQMHSRLHVSMHLSMH